MQVEVQEAYPLEQINADADFNARSLYDEKAITKLARNIKEQGQLTPIVVRRNGGGSVDLVAGFRRLEALKLNKSKTARVQIQVFETDLSAYEVNLLENMARRDLSPHDIAARFVYLNDKGGMDAKTLGQKFGTGEGMSKSHVENLMRIHRKLHPIIREAWKNGDGRCNIDFLLRLAPQDSEDQLVMWEEKGGKTPGEGTDPIQSAGGTDKPKRVSKRDIGKAVEFIKKSKDIPDSLRKVAISCLNFSLGVNDTLRVEGIKVFPFAKVPKKAKAKKKGKKKAKKTK